MKRLLYLFMFLSIVCISQVHAASGTIYVYYKNGTENGVYVSRYDTYNYTKQHMESIGYNVYARPNVSYGISSEYQNAKVLVFHNHGTNGLAHYYINDSLSLSSAKSVSAYIGSNQPSSLFTLSSLSNGSLSNLKLVIYYNCYAGVQGTNYGDLPGMTTSKGTTTALAWNNYTMPGWVNTWNRLFFEKATTDNILASMQHADYWTGQIHGPTVMTHMQNYRVERGNIYASIN